MKISSDYPFSFRSAIYGDGCFTTIAVSNSSAELLDNHIARLQKSCGKLKIDVMESHWYTLKKQLLLKSETLGMGILKVLICAGLGGRGYHRELQQQPLCFIQELPPVTFYEEWQKQGISLGVSPIRLALQEQLAEIKHLNRIEQVLVKQCRSEQQDDLVLDKDGMIVEVSAGNIFWRSFNRWFTPDVSLCGIEGVMRNQILAYLRKEGIPVSVTRTGVEALRKATDVFVCNSLMKLVPVRTVVLNQQQKLGFSNQSIGEVKQLLRQSVVL